MKGFDPKVARSEKLAFGGDITANSLADVKQEDPGIVEFKRVRIALAINRKAQRKKGWLCRYPLVQFTGPNTGPERFGDFEYKRGERDRRMDEVSRALGNLEMI